MPNKTAFAAIIFLLVYAFSAAAAEQAPALAPGEGASAPGEKQEAPPPPVKRVDVTVKNDQLSVDLVDAPFGEVLDAIAQTTPFIKIISPVTSRKTITTRFEDLDMDSGILRLLTIIREKNYMMQYDQQGKISSIEVYSDTGSPIAVKKRPTGAISQQPVPRTKATPPAPSAIPPAASPASPSAPPVPPAVRPAPQVIKNPPVPSRILRFRRPTVPAGPKQEKQPDQQIEEDDSGPDETPGVEMETPVEDAPYIPPAKPPAALRPKAQ